MGVYLLFITWDPHARHIGTLLDFNNGCVTWLPHGLSHGDTYGLSHGTLVHGTWLPHGIITWDTCGLSYGTLMRGTWLPHGLSHRTRVVYHMGLSCTAFVIGCLMGYHMGYLLFITWDPHAH